MRLLFNDEVFLQLPDVNKLLSLPEGSGGGLVVFFINTLLWRLTRVVSPMLKVLCKFLRDLHVIILFKEKIQR